MGSPDSTPEPTPPLPDEPGTDEPGTDPLRPESDQPGLPTDPSNPATG